MLARILIIGALIGLAVWWIASRLRARDREDDATQARRSRQGRARGPQTMVTCARCGLHLPREEAVADDASRWYCGEEHRIAGPRRP
jgi:uncharacterized protein